MKLTEARAPATPPNASVGAVYVQITSGTSDRLLGATTPIANSVEMHSTTESDGMMRMRHMQAVELTAGSPVKFEPGGMHLMLIGLQRPLAIGEKFRLIFRFERAGEVSTEVAVVSPGEIMSHHH